MIFGRNLEQRWESLRIPIYDRTNLFGDMLVDQQNGNVFAFGCEVVECLFDVRDGCLPQ